MKTTNGRFSLRVDSDGEVIIIDLAPSRPTAVVSGDIVAFIGVDVFKKMITKVLARSHVTKAKDHAWGLEYRINELLEEIK